MVRITDCLGSFACPALIVVLMGQAAAQEPGNYVAPGGRAGIVRLLARDELRGSFGFVTGEYGFVVHEGELRNRGSQVKLVQQDGDKLRFGCTGGEKASVVDFGDPRRPDTQHSLFHSLGLSDAKAAILAEGTPGSGVPVQLGHIYFVRI
jgi:hypothetical protein